MTVHGSTKDGGSLSDCWFAQRMWSTFPVQRVHVRWLSKPRTLRALCVWEASCFCLLSMHPFPAIIAFCLPWCSSLLPIWIKLDWHVQPSPANGKMVLLNQTQSIRSCLPGICIFSKIIQNLNRTDVCSSQLRCPAKTAS